MAGSSDISICSNALQELGDDPIASFSLTEGKRARLCGTLWPQVRDALLRAHPWPCLRKMAILAPETAMPDDAFDWDHSFLMPEDWLRTLQVGQREERLDFEMAGRRIYADTRVLYLKYVARVEDPSQWDSALCDLAGLAMQARLAYAITQSASLAELKSAEYKAALKAAKSIAGMDNPAEVWADSPFAEARY